MLNLPTTVSLLQIVTGAAVTSIAIHASWLDMALVGTNVNPGSLNTVVTTVTVQTFVPPPAGGLNRNVKFISVQNTSGTPCPIAVQHSDGVTIVNLSPPTVLPAGWTLQYNTDGVGFVLYDELGNIQQALGA